MTLFFVQFEVVAQSNAPYSYKGIGNRNSTTNPVFSGMGNQFVSYAMPSVLNTGNAASYSFLRHQFPIFSIGLANRVSFNEENGNTEINPKSTISEIAFGLSFSKRFGLAFGLKPMFDKSYSFTQKGTLLTDSIRYDYLGNGSLNKAFIGFSVKILNYDSLQWSIGGNFGSLFGSTNDQRRSAIINTLTNAGGGDIRTQQVRSFHYDLGTIIKFRLGDGNRFTIGGTFEPIQQIRSTYSKEFFYSLSDVSNTNSWETLTYSGENKGKITFAPSYNLGISYSKRLVSHKKNGNERNSELMVSASYSSTDWSKYKEKYSDSTHSYNFNKSTGFQIGIQYTPETQYIGNAMPKFFDRSSYRVGFYNNTLPYIYNNSQLTESAVTIGFGFPMLVDRRLDSSIQLGFAAGKRGTTDAGAFNEKFIAFNIGFLIAPSINDRWFVKRKLD